MPRITNVVAQCNIGTSVDLKHVGLYLDKNVSLEYQPTKFPAITMRQRLPLKIRRVRGLPVRLAHSLLLACPLSAVCSLPPSKTQATPVVPLAGHLLPESVHLGYAFRLWQGAPAHRPRNGAHQGAWPAADLYCPAR